jgi:hypothetical protein
MLFVVGDSAGTDARSRVLVRGGSSAGIGAVRTPRDSEADVVVDKRSVSEQDD